MAGSGLKLVNGKESPPGNHSFCDFPGDVFIPCHGRTFGLFAGKTMKTQVVFRDIAKLFVNP